MSTLSKIAAVTVSLLALAVVSYAFLWGRVSWLPPRKK